MRSLRLCGELLQRKIYLIRFVGFSKYQKKISLKCLVGLSFAVLFGTLLVGLRPKDFNFSNNVKWITDQSGIRFSKYGIAYTDPIIEVSKEDRWDRFWVLVSCYCLLITGYWVLGAGSLLLITAY